jgi:predicted PurR-regulated permease PerM
MATERFHTVLFFALLALALALCFALVLPFLHLIAMAVVLAILVSPLHRALARRIRHRSLAAGLSCLLAVVVLIVPVTFMAAEAVQQTTTLAQSLQSAVRQGQLSRWLRPLDVPLVATAHRWLEQRLDLSTVTPEMLIRQTIGQVSSFLAKQSLGMVKNVAGGLIQAGLTLITLFFLLRDTPRLLAALRPFLPLDNRQTDALLQRVVDMIHANVYGAAVVAVTQGALGGLAFWVLGLPSPLWWGIVMMALCFVPLVGAPVVWVPAALALAVQGAYGKALGLTLWGVLVIGLVDNFLRPLVIGARTQQHPLIVFFSVFGGLVLLGPLGLLLGPMILATALALLEILPLKLAEPGIRPPCAADGANSRIVAQIPTADRPPR